MLVVKSERDGSVMGDRIWGPSMNAVPNFNLGITQKSKSTSRTVGALIL